ncbi:hypothetical protein CLOLEP_02004 [[Clostridium] leptum DSM 753]|uniref:Uncharacterized protein n=1 Tax=[Clostridium] leptum DSM 753 TaxID=428125 RepID=A7VTW1_9FIRM|nr:hypothetical protein CLOLEP_02004 [[Clostridium] leptum DSM 753]
MRRYFRGANRNCYFVLPSLHGLSFSGKIQVLPVDPAAKKASVL